MDKRIALEMGAKYLSTLNDIEFMELLRQTGTIDETQYASLTRKYKDIDLKKEAYVQENWKSIAKEQAEMDAIIQAEMDAYDSNPNGYMSQIMSEIEK